MSLSILTNSAAMATQENLLTSSQSVAKSMERLSSGLRINSAADDAAGYAISEGITSQTNGLDQATKNTNDAISEVQTASGSLTSVQNMLQRVRELAVQYNNGSNSTTDKAAIQSEVDQLTNEMDRQRTASNFNGTNLLNGSAGTGGTVTYQVGANNGDTLSATFADIQGTSGLSASTGFTWANVNNASAHVFDLSQAGALTNLDAGISNITKLDVTLGAVQNRLQYTSDAINSEDQNLTATNSTIKDVNMATEMTRMTGQQILEQAGTSMLAQANAQPQLILKLLA